MRMKAVFSVFARKLPSGKVVYYYQCYDEKGKRQIAKSTGKNKKTEATAFCMNLYKSGLLIPEQKTPDFAEYSAGWWDVETCRYLQWRRLHEPLTEGTIDIHRNNFANHLKPFFGPYKLNDINGEAIENWFIDRAGKGLKAGTINLALRTFKIMLGEAVKQKLIKRNPCDDIKDLKNNGEERIIMTADEAAKLFPKDWRSVWESFVIYKAHRLASCTGLRAGELRGLRGECVFDDYIFIRGQYTRYGYSPNTKTKHNRNIPVTPLIRRELEELIQLNGDGYVFSEDGGKNPVTAERINRQFDRACERIGISHEERLKRKLSFHSWRHYFNTVLRVSNVADSKVQAVTGHLTMRMTDHYTHFDTREFNEIREVQEKLLSGKQKAGRPVRSGKKQDKKAKRATA